MHNTTNGEILTNVNIDNMLGSILSNFDSKYIIDIVRDSINMRFRPFNVGMPGINAFEQNFQNIINSLGDYNQKQRVYEVREQTYQEVIRVLCEYYNLSYNPDENIDIYSVAYYMYDFLVANFSASIINFFTNFIVRNQDMLFAQINPSKENLNNYSKKVYGNTHLGFIHSNLSVVMDNITDMDINIQTLLEYAATDRSCQQLFMYTIIDNNNLFKDHFVPFLKNYSSRTELITSVKLALQEYSTADATLINEAIIRKEK